MTTRHMMTFILNIPFQEAQKHWQTRVKKGFKKKH